MKTDAILNNFVAGEISPKLAGRTDIAQYYQSAAEILNMIVEFYGGAKKAPGTYFVNEVKNSSLSTRIIRFVFSDTQAYIIEIGNLYMRFYMDDPVSGAGGAVLETAINITGVSLSAECLVTAANAYTDGDTVYITGIVGTTQLNSRRFIVSDRTAANFKIKDIDGNYINSEGYTAWVSAGTAARVYTLTTTYTTADIWNLQFAQTFDTLYITLGKSNDAAKGRPQKKLTRTGHAAWTISDIDYSTGANRPALMDSNITTTTITPSADTGVGITLTASVAIFDESHENSIWRVKSGYVKITHVAAGGLKVAATGNVLYSGDLDTGPAAVTDWAEPAWSGYRGFPKSVTISEGRVIYGYTVSQPQTTWGSSIMLYETFELGSDDSDAMDFTSDTNEVEILNWLFPSNEILLGTASGLSSLGTGSDTVALTATTGRLKKKSRYGTSEISPQAIGNNIFYWQKYNRILREYVYNLNEDNYVAGDATAFSEHISESGIIDMAYQQSPIGILWCVRADGKIAAFTRQVEQKVSAWSLHDTQGFYESVTVIPKTTYDEVWFVVRRTINGVTRRYIEYMTAPEFTEQEDAFFVHSGLTLDDSNQITKITSANPPLVTCTNNFTNGDIIRIRNVVGMTEVNYKKYIVAGRTATTFHLHTLAGIDVNGLAYTAYVSGGEARKCFSAISGLEHLEGKTVQVMVDGSNHPNRVVSAGSITLDDTYSQAHVGLGYTARLKTNDLEPAPGQSSAQGKIKRVSNVLIRFLNTLGCKVGDGIIMDDVVFRTSAMPADQAPPLFTNIKEVPFPSGFDRIKQVVITQEQPLPCNILSLIIESEVNS